MAITFNCDKCKKQVNNRAELNRFEHNEQIFDLCNDCYEKIDEIEVKHQQAFEEELDKYLSNSGKMNVNNNDKTSKK